MTPAVCGWALTGLQVAYWVSAIMCCFLVVTVQEFSKWHAYGKLRTGQARGRLASLTVPKKWFVFFYVIAMGWTTVLVWSEGMVVSLPLNLVLHCQVGSIKLFPENPPVLSMSLFMVHVLRRLVEDSRFAMQTKSQAQMHVAGFLLGASYYIAVPVALLSCETQPTKGSTHSTLLLCLGLFVFLLGSRHQYTCHKILRDLRETCQYGIPRGDWFEYSSSPHYFSEMLIYAGLVLVTLGTASVSVGLWLAFVFTVVNLSITGRRTHDWYLDHFGDEYKKLARWAVIPAW